MIEFSCSHCNQKLRTEDTYASRQVKCHKCGWPVQVPAAGGKPSLEALSIIKFRCPGCNQKIGLDKSFAGKTVKCAKCKQPIKVPSGTLRRSAPQPDIEKLLSPKPAPKEVDAADMLGGELFDDQLLAVEANAPPAGEPLKLSSLPAPEQVAAQKKCPRCGELNPAGAGVCATCAFELSPAGLGAKGRKPSSRKSVIIAAIMCILSIVLLGIVVAIVYPAIKSLKPKTGPRNDEAKQLAERFVNLVRKNDFGPAKGLLTPQTQKDINDAGLEHFAKFIGKNSISDVNLGLTYFEPQQDGDCYFLSYNIGLEDDSQGIILAIREISNDLKIDAVAASQFFSRDSIQIGAKTYDELSGIVFNTAAAGLGAALSRSCCALAVVLVVLVVIQVISMWVVFDKAGHPGWAAIIPFYNMWVLAEVGDKPGWLGLAVCFSGAIPYVGWIISIVISIVIAIGVAKAFSRGVLFGLGLALLSFIFYPILAFASD